jgi:hypothetical protein
VPVSIAEPGTHAHYVRAVLRERGFRRLLSTRVLAQIGDGFFQGGLAGSVLFNPNQGANGVAIVAGFAALLLPYSLISPYLGVFLDRWSRRTIIFVANLLRSLLVVPATLLIWHGSESLPLFFLVLAIIGLSRFFLAGLAAATPHVVDDHMLVTANSMASTLGSIMFSLGLGGTAVLVKTALNASFHGYAAVAVAAVPLYFAAAVVGRTSFGTDDLGPDAHQRRRDPILAAVREVGRSTVAGLRHLAGKRGAAYAVLAQGVHRGLYGVLLLGTLLLYRTIFNTGKDVTGSFGPIGQAFLVGGAGLLLAAFVTPPIARRIGGWRWVTGLLASTALAIAGFGLVFDLRLMLVAVFVLNLTAQGLKIVVDTSLQHECDDQYRGRVFSVNDTAFNLLLVVGMYVGALVLPDNGKSTAVIMVVALLYALLAIGYGAVAGGWARRVGDDIAQPDGARPAPKMLAGPKLRGGAGPLQL